jgi:aminopeptidase N
MSHGVASSLGALGLAITLAMPAAAAAPFDFDSAPGRLPKDVVPRSYRIAVQPDPDALALVGQESVALDFRKATDTIIFNSLNQQLRDVRLDGRAALSVVSDDGQQITTVHLPAPARAGKHTLTFSYSGKVETQPHGLFLQTYLNADGSKGRLLSTKMESTDARRMFPCWDEPAFRSTIELTVTVPAAWSTVSNMPVAKRVAQGSMATTTFKTSPRMPTYLIEFSAGDLAAITTRLGSTALSVWAVRGREQNGRLALANAKQILADYNDYFGYPYPLPKLDSIAVPGGFQGAMENWGAITFNDQLLLVTPASTMTDQQSVFSAQAHEMAHQWNGDLVTMGWWDDLWLNESFASLRAANETDLRFPDWKWAEHQDLAKERAMAPDAQISTHPIQQHIANELQAANAFDAITYEKGQVVLRMFEAYLRLYQGAGVLQRHDRGSLAGAGQGKPPRHGSDSGGVDRAAGIPAGIGGCQLRFRRPARYLAVAIALPVTRHSRGSSALERAVENPRRHRCHCQHGTADARWSIDAGRALRRTAQRKCRCDRLLPCQLRCRHAGP